MIIYLATREEFLKHVREQRIEEEVRERFIAITGHKVAASEFRAWKNSLQCVGNVLQFEEIPSELGVVIERRLHYVSQETCSCGHSRRFNSAGNTSVTPFNSVTVAYSSLPKATGTSADMGSNHTDRQPIIPAKCSSGCKGRRDATSFLGISPAKQCLPGIICF